jgi:SAM-dependent methyltransferase
MPTRHNQECFLCGSKKNMESVCYNNILVRKCNICEFNYIPGNENYIGKDYYSQYYERRNTESSLKLNNLRRDQYKLDANWLSKYMTNDKRILDVGCSSGVFLSEIYKITKSKYLSGIDIDNSAIIEAKKHLSDVAEFRNKRLLEVFDKFDLIIFRGSFQYLDKDLHRSIKHLKGMLNHNGKIIIYSLPTTDSFVYHLLKDKWALFHPEMSLMFNQKSLEHLLGLHSLNISRLDYPYIDDVYANIERDYIQVERIVSGLSKESTPFWGGVMRVVISGCKK